MNDFGVMQYAAAGMEAQRSALDVLAQNLALVQTADPKHPVHTLVPQFSSTPEGDEFAASLGAQRAFEASAAVFDTGKRLIEKTLSVEQGT